MARDRRHPAHVTADRLRDALDRWPDDFDGQQRDVIGLLIVTLETIGGRSEIRRLRGQQRADVRPSGGAREGQ